MQVIGTELQIDNKIIQSYIQPPTPGDVIKHKKEFNSEMNSFELLATRPTQQKGSTFQGFAVYASKLLGVSLAYSKVCITVPKARHIMCAYNVAGMRDSCNDGEDHAGILIEKMLHAQNLSGVAVFIARETGPD